MEPKEADIRLINQIVTRVRRLSKRNHIEAKKLNLDYVEFEVLKGKVHDGICLYYSEDPARVQASTNIWYTKNLSPISLNTQNWQENLPGYLKLLMGGKDWYKDKHHLRTIGRAKPTGFFGARMAQWGIPYALFFKFPQNTRIYSYYPQPIECYAEDNRLNLLFLLATKSPEPQPRSLDISYEILKDRV